MFCLSKVSPQSFLAALPSPRCANHTHKSPPAGVPLCRQVPHTSIHEPTAAMLVNHLLAYHAKKGSDATNESLQRVCRRD